jgi:AcrR family transcriptional regulator
MSTTQQEATTPQEVIQSKPRKEEILDVATALFAEKGYEGTSMNDVAARVGMRKASLFYHFATKDALYEAVLDRLIATLGSALQTAYEGGGTFAERTEAATDTTTLVLGSHPYAARLLLRETMDWGPVMRGKLLERATAVFDAGVAFIRAGQEAGELVEGDAKQLVLTALGVHFVPFALAQYVEHVAGSSPYSEGFIADRKAAVRRQMHDLFLRK